MGYVRLGYPGGAAAEQVEKGKLRFLALRCEERVTRAGTAVALQETVQMGWKEVAWLGGSERGQARHGIGTRLPVQREGCSPR